MIIGILNSGGDCPGINAVIEGYVSAAYRRGWRVIGFHDGFEGLLPVAGGRRYETLTPNKTHKIRAHGGTILGTTSTGNFKVVTNKVGRRQVDREVMAKAKKTINALGLEALAVIGGSGSARTASLLSEEGLPVISIPKTINNDLCSDSDYTFGFHSAVTVVTESIDRIRTTANAHQRMMVIEVMGDMSGWIALYGGIAAAADVVLIPEIDYDLDKVIECIKARKATGQREIIVVVAEGSRLNGQLVTVHNKENGDERLGGIGNKITQILQERTGIETRYCVLGHTQRGGSPCAFDRILGVRFGVEAVKLIEKKDFGKTVVLNGLNIDNVPIEEAVAHHRFVSPDSQVVSTARDLGIIFGDRNPEEMHKDRAQASTKGSKPARKCCKSKSAASK
ncbi:MAG: ATP-dependent 6-phosphofructokinase [Akkermansiaceae bacterium]|nr:ATP-dependent 6-phosphofructokinase [Akkermansiaceae bacterium]